MNDVYIVGSGGLAREISILVKQLHVKGEIGKFCGFISSTPAEIGKQLSQGEIVGSDTHLPFNNGTVDIIIAIGYPHIKKKLTKYYSQFDNIKFPNIFDENARIDKNNCDLGIGNIFTSGTFISCDVTIGNFNLFNWNSTIGHDAKIGSSCVINPQAHISGFCTVGDSVLIGAGAITLERVNIGSNSIVGAGAVVTNNVDEGSTVVGIPAKGIKK